MNISDIRAALMKADALELASLERSLRSDTRKGVQNAIVQAKKRLEAQEQEERRLSEAIAYEADIVSKAHGTTAVGLDEVGRGPLAGPLSVGAVVLPAGCRIEGLDDSKRVSPQKRESMAQEIKGIAVAYSVVHIPASFIDEQGIMAALKKAFSEAVANIEKTVHVDVVLLDGLPMGIDPREVNIVKGDRLCPSISAASIIAKVERDALMERYALDYPRYGFEIHKGYGTDFHRDAIEKYGLCDIHRKTYCAGFNQQKLF